MARLERWLPGSSWLRRLVVGVAAVVALLVAAVAAVPLFVDGDRVRHAVEQWISHIAGGEVRYDSLELRFFPQPRAEIRNATISIPGAVAGRIGTLEIRIAPCRCSPGTSGRWRSTSRSRCSSSRWSRRRSR
jgi:hypothetical protein